jgi:hypothetical protein
MEIMREARLRMPLNRPGRITVGPGSGRITVGPAPEQPSGAAKGQTHK